MGVNNTGGSATVLTGFTLHKQETPVSCGPASAKMALQILGIEVPEAELRRRMRTNSLVGTPTGFLRRGYQACLQNSGMSLRVRVLSGSSVTSRTLVESLERGRPVIACFLTENHFRPGTMVGHYSVIYGIDVDANTIRLANTFGSKDTVELERFWEMTEFDLTDGYIPFFQKLLMRLGKLFRMVVPRTIVVLEDE